MKFELPHKLAWSLLALGIVVGLTGAFLSSKPVLIAGILIACVGLVAQAYQFQCPNCGKHLGTDRYGNNQCCPHCGSKLDQP